MSFPYKESYQSFCKAYFSWNTQQEGRCFLTQAKKEAFALELFLVLKGIKKSCYFKMGDEVNGKTHKDLIQLIKDLKHPNLKIVESFSMRESLYKTVFFNGSFPITEEDLKNAFTDLERGNNSFEALSTEEIQHFARTIGATS